ncbi:MAG: hypothetical protein JWP91_2875 [Fibrobacteres bacterium]|nr:hypothetical protein [Fibrobacterota bacterium]
MRTAALRFCLSGLILSALPVLTHAALEYSVKAEAAEVFRTEALEPPPLGTLAQGESLKLLRQGNEASLIRTPGGLKGWVRNEDLTAVKAAKGLKFGLDNVDIYGCGWNQTIDVWIAPNAQAELLSLNRSFAGEIVEARDREQVEMGNDEN